MDIQQGITLLAVGIAAFFLGRHLLKSVSVDGDATCGGCGRCGKPAPRPSGVRSAPATNPLIGLSASPRRKIVNRTIEPTKGVKPDV